MIRICYTYGSVNPGGRRGETGFIEVPAAGEHRHILVVHGGMGDLQQLKRVLCGDFRVGLASTVPAAAAYLSAHRPDMMLVDAELSACSGSGALGVFRTSARALPTAVLFSDSVFPACDSDTYVQGFIAWPAPAQIFLEDVRAFAAHSLV